MQIFYPEQTLTRFQLLPIFSPQQQVLLQFSSSKQFFASLSTLEELQMETEILFKEKKEIKTRLL